jgi:hypothetical protein
MMADDSEDPGLLNRQDMIAGAWPPCHECGDPVQRVEGRWHLDDDARWQPGPFYMVCRDGHRVLVETLG